MDDTIDLEEKLRLHALWLANKDGGERLVLCYADLHSADLRSANLRYADLRSANLSSANLRYADLSYADLRSADLRSANLSSADLSYADLSYADLRSADLRSANLSDAKGLLDACKWMQENFESDKDGYIVYKRFGATQYLQPQTWIVAPGSIIEEVVNPLPTLDCACGVNFGTRKWCDENYTTATLWKCRLRWRDLPALVVPYHTDGKARCSRLELIEEVK